MCLTQFTTKPCYTTSNSISHKIKVWVLFVFEMFKMNISETQNSTTQSNIKYDNRRQFHRKYDCVVLVSKNVFYKSIAVNYQFIYTKTNVYTHDLLLYATVFLCEWRWFSFFQMWVYGVSGVQDRVWNLVNSLSIGALVYNVKCRFGDHFVVRTHWERKPKPALRYKRGSKSSNKIITMIKWKLEINNN